MTCPAAISRARQMSLGCQSDDSPVVATKCRDRNLLVPLEPRMSGTLGDDFASTLLAMAGHDLRQPLQIITNAHEALLAMLGSEEERTELAFAVDATARLARMLCQLVEALHLHQRPSQSLTRLVRLPPLLKRLAAEFDRQAGRKGIKFSVNTAAGTVLSEPVLLTGILRNLIYNAINYTPSGGSVSVSCSRRGWNMRIEIRDTGYGIPTAALPRVFKAFERAGEGQVDGLGLGLFIVKRAADFLGHRIEVRSVEGQGSWFSVVAQAPC